MNVTFVHLKAAEKTLLDAKAMAGKHYGRTVREAAVLARGRIRSAAPRARNLQPGSHYASGTPRKAGDLRRAVAIRYEGLGFGAKATVHAGGVAPIIAAGSRSHEIDPKNGRALAIPASIATKGKGFAGAIAVAHVHVAGVKSNPFVARGIATALPEIDAIIARTGHTIVSEMAADIRRGR